MPAILSLKEMKAGGSRDQSHPQVYSSCRLAQAVVKNLSQNDTSPQNNIFFPKNLC